MRSDFDRWMKEALTEKVKDVEPSEQMLENIRKEAEERRKETGFMKFGMKKIVAVAAVCVLSVTAYAATQLASVSVGTTNNITAYEDVAKAEKKLDMDAKYVERFENGFAFDRAGTGQEQGRDEEGNPVGNAYNVLTISYKNEEGQILHFLVQDGNSYVDAGQEAFNGYTVSANKFVPPDYELTEEDKAMQAAGELNIAYGSEKVELKTYESYYWQDGDLYYSLGAFDCDLGEAALKDMAAQIMAE